PFEVGDLVDQVALAVDDDQRCVALDMVQDEGLEGLGLAGSAAAEHLHMLEEFLVPELQRDGRHEEVRERCAAQIGFHDLIDGRSVLCSVLDSFGGMCVRSYVRHDAVVTPYLLADLGEKAGVDAGLIVYGAGYFINELARLLDRVDDRDGEERL